MTDPDDLVAAVRGVSGVRHVLQGVEVLPTDPVLVEVRVAVRRSATSRTVARAVAARVREVLGADAQVRVVVAAVE